MRKRVTFGEQLKKGNVNNAGGHIIARSAECEKRDTDGFKPGHHGQQTFRETNTTFSASSRHMTTIHVPKTLMSAPFLQHPALTAGQRRYLCSIADVYSTEHMRQQMKRHYLHVLHTCVSSGCLLLWFSEPIKAYMRVCDGSQVRILPAEGDTGIISKNKPAGSQKTWRRMLLRQNPNSKVKAAELGLF